MKNLIAISAATLVAATASANYTLYTTVGSAPIGTTAGTGWLGGSSYYPTTTIITDTLQYAVQTNSNLVTYAAPGNGYHSWANWTASASSVGTSAGALTLSGGYLNPAQLMTASPAGRSITITFDSDDVWAPGAEQGIMGAGIDFTSSGTVGTITVAFVNGTTTTTNFAAVSSGFVGLWVQNPQSPANNWVKIASITISTDSANTLGVTGIYVGLVPAPGAVALLGVAGLVGSRRRRA